MNYDINILGSYFVSTHSNSKDIDLNVYTLGVGYHEDISDSTDILAEISLFNTNTDSFKISKDNSGHTLSLGVRHKPQEKLELNARFDHRNSSDVTNNTFTLGSRYYFKPDWSVGLDFNTGADDGSESITGSLRWYFK